MAKVLRWMVLLGGSLFGAGSFVLAAEPAPGPSGASQSGADESRADRPGASQPGSGEPGTTVDRSLKWLVSQRDDLSRGLGGMAESIDTFFAGEGGAQENETHVRIQLAQVFEKAGEVYPDNDISAKLDLPDTEKRLRFVFETDPDELRSVEERSRDVASSESRISDSDDAVGAVRFMLRESRHWDADFDVGLRARLPLDAFVRFNAEREQQISDNWVARLKQSFYYFHSDGAGSRTRFYLERPITEDYFLRNRMEAQYYERDNRWEYAQVLSTYHWLSDRQAVDYQVAVIGESKPVPRVSSYYIGATLRRRIHEDWLFMELSPVLAWPRDEGFDLTPSFTVRLEVVFSRAPYDD